MSVRRLVVLAPSLALVGALVWSPVAPAAPAPGGGGATNSGPTARRTLANGLVVAVFQDDRQPLVQMQLLVPAGSVEEPAGESGLANLTFQMLGHGTASRTGAAFDQAVQALGGSIGGSVSREFATVNGTFLAGDMESGLELIADAVVNPLFGEEVLRAIKGQAVSGVANARGNPVTLADDHLWAGVFADHPYGRPPLGAPQMLSGLGVAQVQGFHRRHYRPDRALLAIAGDVAPERAFKAVEEQLGSWGGRAGESAGDSLAPPDGFRVRIVDVPQATRTELRLGAAGPARSDPDYEALSIAAELLNAGGEPGLRASGSGLRQAGLFSVAWSASVDSAGESVARLRATLARAAQAPPNDRDLAAAKRRLLGVAALQLDTRGGAIAQWMAGVLYPPGSGRAADHASRVGSIMPGHVAQALARHVTPERTVLVAVGPADRLRQEFHGLGTIEVVPAEAAAEVIESPSTTRRAATPAQGIRGKALVSQALAAHGGLERLRAVKDSRLEGDMVMMPGGERTLTGQIVQIRKDPDRFWFETTLSVLKSLQVLDGDRGWSRAGDPPAPVEDLDSVSVAGLRAGFRSDLVHLLLSAADPATRVAWRGRETRDDRNTEVVEVVSGGERRLLFLDVASHHVIASEQNDGGRSARRIFRDLRDVKGVMWPFFEERYLDGQRAVTLTLSKVALNTGVDDAMFVKPGSKPPASGRSPSRPRAR